MQMPPEKVIDGFNMDKDGMTARPIKSQYGKNSAANFTRQNSYGATAVIEIHHTERAPVAVSTNL